MSKNKRSASSKRPRLCRYADEVRIDEKKVPEKLRCLIPYAKYWSIGDDVDRAKLMARTSRLQKKALADAVWPHWNELHAWCESNDWSNEGVIFTALIEAVAEARLEIYLPDPSPPVCPAPQQAAETKAAIESIISLLQNPFPDDPEFKPKGLAEIRALGDKLAAECKEPSAFHQSGGGAAGPGHTEPTAARNGGSEAQSATESVGSSSANFFQDFPEPVAKELAEINAKLDQLLARHRMPRACSKESGNELTGRDTRSSGAPDGGSTTRLGD